MHNVRGGALVGGRVIPLIDRTGAEPVKIGDGVTIRDEKGVRFAGRVTAPAPDGGFYASDFIRSLWDHDHTKPIDTKENTMNTKIRISATFAAGGGIATRGGPRADVEIKTSLEDTDKIEALVNAAQFSGCDLLRAMGIAPYEPPMDIAVAEPKVDLPTREFEDGDGQRADDDDEEGGEPERETPEAEWLATRQAAYKRMHDAIGSEAPNIIDVAKELAQGAEGEEGSEAFRGRLGVLAKALSASADGLTNARNPF